MLSKHRIVVTGVAGGLGQAVAKLASNYGAEVIGLDILDDYHSEFVSRYEKVDLTNRNESLAAIGDLGCLDALVNVAGGFGFGTEAFATDNEQWDLMFRINVETARNAIIAATPLLKENRRGRIVNIGALSALSGQGQMSAYCCAKSTVMRLTESLSEELKHSGINVNAVLPSIIDTPANRNAMPDANFDEWVSPEQLAEVICFLASEAASAVHGALIPVKGLV